MSDAFDAFTPDDAGNPIGERSTREGGRPRIDNSIPGGRSRVGHVDLSDICVEDLQVVAGAVDRWRSLRPPTNVTRPTTR